MMWQSDNGKGMHRYGMGPAAGVFFRLCAACGAAAAHGRAFCTERTCVFGKQAAFGADPAVCCGGTLLLWSQRGGAAADPHAVASVRLLLVHGASRCGTIDSIQTVAAVCGKDCVSAGDGGSSAAWIRAPARWILPKRSGTAAWLAWSFCGNRSASAYLL